MILYLILTISVVRGLVVLQISDVHLDVQYSIHGDPFKMCHVTNDSAKKYDLGTYGNYKCDPPKILWTRLVEAAAKAVPNPDLVVLSGDYLPHVDYYTIEMALATIKLVTDEILSKFGNSTEVVPVLGNHDAVPANYYPENSCEICERVYSLWEDWTGTSLTFKEHGYYLYNWKKGNLTIMALNTNIYYDRNAAIKNFKNKDDPAKQFEFMEKELEKAKNSRTGVGIVSHIAPGAYERSPGITWMIPEYNRHLIDITLKYADTIKWMVFGHHHSDTFHIVKDEKSNVPRQVYLISPAVTPWFDPSPGSGSVNPSFRVYKVDDKTQQFLDATTYYVNLTKLNEDSATTWVKEYSMSEAYGIASVNATEMNKVLERLKSNDHETWKRYIMYNSVMCNLTIPEGIYRAGQLCSIEHPRLDEYHKCLTQLSPEKSLNYLLLILSTVIFLGQ